MRIQQFLEHHGLSQNPFSQEDAQSDPLFKRFCAQATFHPAWDKICGNPGEPSTAVVFGEKGSGKTALRLQVVDQISEHNIGHPNDRVFVVEYDDFNPFLDNFRQHVAPHSSRPERALSQWKLWDHMDAILSLATTRLVDDVLEESHTSKPGAFEIHADRLASLSRSQKRDLLLLAAFFDKARSTHPATRWNALRRKLRFANFVSWWELGLGSLATLVLFGVLAQNGSLNQLGRPWPWLVLLVAWGPWLIKQTKLLWLAWRVCRQVRVLNHPLIALKQVLAGFESKDLVAQPVPAKDRSDDRYEFLSKLQSVLRTLGFTGMVVIVDRVDEPHLINGNAERMRDLMWPMFDNKFLKHSGLGFKLLLPVEISHFLSRENPEFYERSRLDKQNMIRSLEWTGESLYDLANDRIKACTNGSTNPPKLLDWFDSSVTEAELVSTLSQMRVPRHLFKFLHQLLVEHCNRFTDGNPQWKIDRSTLHAALAVYRQNLKAYDLGMGPG